jgi:hypothetical protein
MTEQLKHDISSGDRVYDKYQQSTWGEDPSELVVVDVHENARADEYPLEGIDGTLNEIVDDWPVDMPDSYDAAADGVVEVAFHEDLDRAFGGAWVTWSDERLKELCKINDVVVYSYHYQRLTPKH